MGKQDMICPEFELTGNCCFFASCEYHHDRSISNKNVYPYLDKHIEWLE